MSGLALVALRARRDRHGLGPRRLAATSERVRARGDRRAVIGHDAANVPAGDDVELVVSTAIAPTTPSAWSPASAACARSTAASCSASSARLRRTIADRRHARQDDDDLDGRPRAAAHRLGPAYVIGGELRTTGHERRRGAQGDWLVVEADESDRSFLELRAEIAVVTNIELDHHTTYASLAELEQAFARVPARRRCGASSRTRRGRGVPRPRRDRRRRVLRRRRTSSCDPARLALRLGGQRRWRLRVPGRTTSPTPPRR